MRIISPPRHGGKASVWRNRSAIPHAPRPWFRFGNVGSFCQTPPCRRVANRSRVLDRTPHCYSLLFSLFFIVICAGGNAGRSAQIHATQGEIRRSVQRRHCISLLLTMPRCGSAAHDTKSGQHDVRPQSGHALPLRARCWPASSPGSALSSSRCQTARSARRRQGVFLACAARNRRPRDRLRKTTSNANLSSIITLRSQ
jgi:hypothetical protein